jgi:hypothetical protein
VLLDVERADEASYQWFRLNPAEEMVVDGDGWIHDLQVPATNCDEG